MQMPSGLKLLRVNEGLVRGYILILKLIAMNHSTVSTYILKSRCILLSSLRHIYTRQTSTLIYSLTLCLKLSELLKTLSSTLKQLV
jgi:hypothetical protein